MADLLGYAASCAVLASFLMRTMRPLRLVAILSNVLFLTYGYVEHIQPVFFLHLALLPINLWRLFVHWNDAASAHPRIAVASRPARAASTPYAIWFAVGLFLGMLGPLPLLLIVDKSEAAKLIVPFLVAPTPAQSSLRPPLPSDKNFAVHPSG
jgi:hypothetical protein